MTEEATVPSEEPRTGWLRIGSEEITLARVVLEIGVIVLAVLLALAADQWRQGRADDRLAEATVQAVRSEMAANVNALTRALETRNTQIELFRNGGEGQFSLQAAFLRTDAWETAQSVGAAPLLDFDLISKLSEIHQLQLEYQWQSRTAGQIVAYAQVFAPLFVEVEDARAMFSGFVQVLYDMRSLESSLLARYEELGELIGSESPPR